MVIQAGRHAIQARPIGLRGLPVGIDVGGQLMIFVCVCYGDEKIVRVVIFYLIIDNR